MTNEETLETAIGFYAEHAGKGGMSFINDATIVSTLALLRELEERRVEVEKYKAWAASCDEPPAPLLTSEQRWSLGSLVYHHLGDGDDLGGATRYLIDLVGDESAMQDPPRCAHAKCGAILRPDSTCPHLQRDWHK